MADGQQVASGMVWVPRRRLAPAPDGHPRYPQRSDTTPTAPDHHRPGSALLAAARRLGPLPWSALDPPAPAALPGCAPAALAAALDGLWEGWGRPDPLPVVVAGSAPAAVVAGVLAAGPACAPATRWLVVGSGAGRGDLTGVVPVEEPAVVLGPAVAAADPDEPAAPAPCTGPVAALLAELPAGLPLAVVVAAGLLGALPVDRYERRGHGWAEVRLAADGDGLAEVLVDVGAGHPDLPAPGPGDGRVDDPVGARRWLRAARAVASTGVVLAASALPPPPGLPPADAGLTGSARDRLCPELHVAAWSMREGMP